MFKAFICNYVACDIANITPGCKSEAEELCIGVEFCCIAGEQPKGVGMLEDDTKLCTLGCHCVKYYLKIPTTCIEGKSECLCIRAGAALPFGGPVPTPVCACCAFTLLPAQGLFLPPPTPGPSFGTPEYSAAIANPMLRDEPATA